MSMSPRLLRPRAGGFHPDAADWRSRVIANSGSVSASTMKAVSTFCGAIQAAGIRDRFFRLNLFAGSFQGAFVPLYRGPSLGGTQYGNATDTNVGGLFVSGDYNETGASGGLTSDGTSKYLLCGNVLSQVNRADSHQGVYLCATLSPTTSDRVLLGAGDAAAAGLTLLQIRAAGMQVLRYFSANGGVSWTDSAGESQGFLLGSATSATDSRVYINSIQSGSTQTANRGTGAQASTSMGVFCWNNNGTPTALASVRLGSYSAGLGMTPSQAAAYNTAIQAFQAALTRNV